MSSRVLLVDDHSIVLDGIEALLKQCALVEVSEKVNTAQFAVAHLKRERFDLVISDYSMPDMNGLELVKQAKAINSSTKIIVLSMHEDRGIVQDLICAGVDGYVLKKYTHQELLQAIAVVMNGGQYWSPEINKLLIRGISRQEEAPELTEREVEVLKLLVDELNSREIAERLFISERTVETHRKNLLRKTKSSGTVGLIKYAYANSLVK